MTPYEILLSESQERMLLVVHAGHARTTVARDLRAAGTSRPRSIGRVTDDGVFRARWHGEEVVRAAGRAAHRRRAGLPSARPRSPHGLEELQRARPADRSRARRTTTQALLRAAREPEPLLAASGSTASTTSSSAATRSCGPGGDAAVVRIEGTRQGARADASTATAATACSIPTSAPMHRGGRGGAQRASCSGARAARRHRLPQLRQPREARGHVAVPAGRSRGIRDACRALGTPVVSGNVSFYNETEGRAIPPTPTIAHGRPARRRRASTSTPWFKARGRRRSCCSAARARSSAAASTSPSSTASVRGAPPWIDLEAEKRLQRAVLDGVARAACCARRTTSPRAASRWRSPSAASAARRRGSARAIELEAACGPTRCCSARASRACIVSLRRQHVGRAARAARGATTCRCAVLGEVRGQRLEIGDLVDLPMSRRSRDCWRSGSANGARWVAA